MVYTLIRLRTVNKSIKYLSYYLFTRVSDESVFRDDQIIYRVFVALFLV